MEANEINMKDFKENRLGKWLDIRKIEESKVAGNKGDGNTISKNEKEAKVRRSGNGGKMTGVEDSLPWAQVLLQIIARYVKLQVLTILCPWAFSVAGYLNDEVGQGLTTMSLPYNCLHPEVRVWLVYCLLQKVMSPSSPIPQVAVQVTACIITK